MNWGDEKSHVPREKEIVIGIDIFGLQPEMTETESNDPRENEIVAGMEIHGLHPEMYLYGRPAFSHISRIASPLAELLQSPTAGKGTMATSPPSYTETSTGAAQKPLQKLSAQDVPS